MDCMGKPPQMMPPESVADLVSGKGYQACGARGCVGYFQAVF